MTIALTRPATPRPATVRPDAPVADDAVTITLTIALPPGTADIDAALIADDLRTHAHRRTAARQGRTTVAIAHPHTFRAAAPALRALPPQGRTAAAVSPTRTRRPGIVSPNSPARRDVEAARRRVLAATAVSPASPSLAAEAALVVDLYGRRVRIDGADVDLTYKEYELLAHLARNARRTVTREELMESVWAGAPAETGERTVDVHVRRLRNKLGRYRRLVSTVRGTGYRLDPGSDVSILG